MSSRGCALVLTTISPRMFRSNNWPVTTITSDVKRIRKKFIVVDTQFDAIDTVHGAGYRWKA